MGALWQLRIDSLTTARPVRNLRWIVAAALFLATLINYLDRQILSVVAPMLRRDLHLSNSEYAYAINAFLIPYAIMYAVGGKIIDWLGARRGLAWSLGIWSIASLCHTFTLGLFDLCLYRFFLGTAEPGNFTATIKAISAWFPVRERGFAAGVILSGTGLGAIAAPPVVLWLALHYGWRVAFLVTSLAGLCWLLLWLPLYREPEQHPRISAAELACIAEGRDTSLQSEPSLPWSKILRLPKTWSFIFARIFCDPLGYFYWFWMPSYLVFAKGFSYAQLAKWLWIPYLFQSLGLLAGGRFSGLLIEWKMRPILARQLSLSVTLFLTPVAILSLAANQTSVVIFYISVATFGIGWWGANYNALLMDTTPQASLASTTGLAGTGGAISSLIVTRLTGYAADHNAYRLILWSNAILMLFSIASTWTLFKRTPSGTAFRNNAVL
jgi:ACS family hexuronate transporter-like MFS transporter